MKLNFTIGADPEISFLYGNKRIHAGQFLEKTNSQQNNTIYLPEGQIGVDGCSSTGELRPLHSDDPLQLADNIKELITELAKKANILDLDTTNFYAPIGGHVHFSMCSENTWCSMSSNERVKLINRYVKMLATFQMPLIASYNKTSEALRQRKYGDILDVKTENRKDIRVLEYRSPNAEWLTTEKICRSTLAYYAVVYNEIHNNYIKMDKKCKKIMAKNQNQFSALQDLLIADYASISKNILQETKQIIKTFELYQEYKKEVDYILDFKAVYKDKEAAEFNISKGWGLTTNVLMSKKSMFNTKEIENRIKDKNLDALANFLNIAYNKDHNCQGFANSIAKRAIAYNWRMKNYYFIYGLRKGLNDYIVSDKNNEVYTEIKQITGSNDILSLNNLLKKVLTKFSFAIELENRRNSLDITEYKQNKIYMIGIPYEDRDKMNTKTFLNLILKLEKNQLTPINYQKMAFKEEIGELSKAIELRTEENLEEARNTESHENIIELIRERNDNE